MSLFFSSDLYLIYFWTLSYNRLMIFLHFVAKSKVQCFNLSIVFIFQKLQYFKEFLFFPFLFLVRVAQALNLLFFSWGLQSHRCNISSNFPFSITVVLCLVKIFPYLTIFSQLCIFSIYQFSLICPFSPVYPFPPIYRTRANKGRGLYSKNIFLAIIAATNQERLLFENHFSHQFSVYTQIRDPKKTGQEKFLSSV